MKNNNKKTKRILLVLHAFLTVSINNSLFTYLYFSHVFCVVMLWGGAEAIERNKAVFFHLQYYVIKIKLAQRRGLSQKVLGWEEEGGKKGSWSELDLNIQRCIALMECASLQCHLAN